MKTVSQYTAKTSVLRRECQNAPRPAKCDRSVVVFALYFGELPMLKLSSEASGWTLAYTSAFRRQDRVRPLVLFPDVNKIYRSAGLWPFFAVRIPSIERPEIEQTVRMEKLDYSDKAAMLVRFGMRCISDPFELRPLNEKV